jgi:hypothetical protein
MSISMRKRTPLMVRSEEGTLVGTEPEVRETVLEVRDALPVARVVELLTPETPAERVELPVARVVELLAPETETPEVLVEGDPEVTGVVPLKTSEVVEEVARSWTRAKSVPGEGVLEVESMLL